MQQSKTHILSGWGRTPRYLCKSWRAEQVRHAEDIVTHASEALIARGCGRSYGDAALQPDGVLHVHRMDKILSYDVQTGIFTAQSGVTLRDIMQRCVKDGWMVPVLSGTQHVSLGGALASNIHGKNHYCEGNIADHVLECSIMLANGEVAYCSHTENSDLFYATAGGMGMTGIILDVTLQLKRISSTTLESATKKVDSLEAMLECFDTSKDTSDYMVGWIDHFATGKKLGRGVFERAVHQHNGDATYPLQVQPPKKAKTVPDIIPSFLLNRYSMALYNLLRFRKYDEDWREEISGFEQFFHPLDNLNHWNRLYGKKGFYQYQCIIPDNNKTLEHITQFLQTIQKKRCFSYLAVMKYHQPHHSMLGFDMAGYSIALDFPNAPKFVALQGELNQMIAEMGGRVYLAKDALLERRSFEAMYAAELADWKAAIKQIDPNFRFRSVMAERLGFKDGAS